MLQIKFSNRFERLQEALLDAMATPPASPFVCEEIIVPSAAIRRRVELAAADRFGICANVRFSFLAQWLWRQIGHVVDGLGNLALHHAGADLARARDPRRARRSSPRIRRSPRTCATRTR